MVMQQSKLLITDNTLVSCQASYLQVYYGRCIYKKVFREYKWNIEMIRIKPVITTQKLTVRIAAQIFQDKTVGYLYSETVIEWTRTQDEKIT